MEIENYIENTEEAKRKEGWLYGKGELELTRDDLKALAEGKCLSTSINHEYRIFITLG